MSELVGQPKKEKIIDMRGPQVALLDGFESIAEGQVQPQMDGSLKELRHNVSLLVKMTEFDIQALDGKLRQEDAKLAKVKSEHNKFEQDSSQSSHLMDQLEDVSRCPHPSSFFHSNAMCLCCVAIDVVRGRFIPDYLFAGY